LSMAGKNAGIQARFPGYKPSGYALSTPITYGTQRVTISFKSTTDNRTYDVSEMASPGNATYVRDNIVASQDQNFESYEDNGQVIYIYNNSNAVWVKGNMLYQIASNAALNSDQLIKIAQSI
jgi:hypothetical protein